MQDEGLRKLTKDKVLRVIKGQEKKRDIQLVFFLPLSLSLSLIDYRVRATSIIQCSIICSKKKVCNLKETFYGFIVMPITH